MQFYCNSVLFQSCLNINFVRHSNKPILIKSLAMVAMLALPAVMPIRPMIVMLAMTTMLALMATKIISKTNIFINANTQTWSRVLMPREGSSGSYDSFRRIFLGGDFSIFNFFSSRNAKNWFYGLNLTKVA